MFLTHKLMLVHCHYMDIVFLWNSYLTIGNPWEPCWIKSGSVHWSLGIWRMQCLQMINGNQYIITSQLRQPSWTPVSIWLSFLSFLRFVLHISKSSVSDPNPVSTYLWSLQWSRTVPLCARFETRLWSAQHWPAVVSQMWKPPPIAPLLQAGLGIVL